MDTSVSQEVFDAAFAFCSEWVASAEAVVPLAQVCLYHSTFCTDFVIMAFHVMQKEFAVTTF